jgi:hypothetical protein
MGVARGHEFFRDKAVPLCLDGVVRRAALGLQSRTR